MRHYSLKRQKIERDAQKWRREYRERIGKCDACGTTQRLSLHELGLARGPNREKFLMEPCGLLCLCLADIAACIEGCHTIWDKRPEVDQLALLYDRRPDAFDLPRFLFLTRATAPNRITATEILTALRNLQPHPQSP